MHPKIYYFILDPGDSDDSCSKSVIDLDYDDEINENNDLFLASVVFVFIKAVCSMWSLHHLCCGQALHIGMLDPDAAIHTASSGVLVEGLSTWLCLGWGYVGSRRSAVESLFSKFTAVRAGSQKKKVGHLQYFAG